MPQLDKFTFAPQVFWLVVIFFILYLILVKEGLPRLYKILLFRKKKLYTLNESSKVFSREIYYSKELTLSLISSFVFKLRANPEVCFKAADSILEVVEQKNVILQDRVKDLLSEPVSLGYLRDSLDYTAQTKVLNIFKNE